MQCIGRISGNVSSRVATELTVVIGLSSINVDRIVGKTVNQLCDLERTGDAVSRGRINLHDQILIASGHIARRVLERDVDAAVGSDCRYRELVLVTGPSTTLRIDTER